MEWRLDDDEDESSSEEFDSVEEDAVEDPQNLKCCQRLCLERFRQLPADFQARVSECFNRISQMVV